MKYYAVRSHERAFIFADDCDFTSRIEVDPNLISPKHLLRYFKVNKVSPEHMQSVYDDLVFKLSDNNMKSF